MNAAVQLRITEAALKLAAGQVPERDDLPLRNAARAIELLREKPYTTRELAAALGRQEDYARKLIAAFISGGLPLSAAATATSTSSRPGATGRIPRAYGLPWSATQIAQIVKHGG